jgi:hypothetical protein
MILENLQNGGEGGLRELAFNNDSGILPQILAAKRRQNAAHGASRGYKVRKE